MRSAIYSSLQISSTVSLSSSERYHSMVNVTHLAARFYLFLLLTCPASVFADLPKTDVFDFHSSCLSNRNVRGESFMAIYKEVRAMLGFASLAFNTSVEMPTRSGQQLTTSVRNAGFAHGFLEAHHHPVNSDELQGLEQDSKIERQQLLPRLGKARGMQLRIFAVISPCLSYASSQRYWATFAILLRDRKPARIESKWSRRKRGLHAVRRGHMRTTLSPCVYN